MSPMVWLRQKHIITRLPSSCKRSRVRRRMIRRPAQSARLRGSRRGAPPVSEVRVRIVQLFAKSNITDGISYTVVQSNAKDRFLETLSTNTIGLQVTKHAWSHSKHIIGPLYMLLINLHSTTALHTGLEAMQRLERHPDVRVDVAHTNVVRRVHNVGELACVAAAATREAARPRVRAAPVS